MDFVSCSWCLRKISLLSRFRYFVFVLLFHVAVRIETEFVPDVANQLSTCRYFNAALPIEIYPNLFFCHFVEKRLTGDTTITKCTTRTTSVRFYEKIDTANWWVSWSGFPIELSGVNLKCIDDYAAQE